MENIYLQKEHFENVFKKHLKSSVYSLSIKTLFGDRYTKKVKYDPYYQRNYVWDVAKASFFIESILLGTDIPPLIFFNSGARIEVIDGRQRYETIKRFKNGDLKLSVRGLTKLTQLKNHTFSKLQAEMQEIFDSAKIRIFEFEVINEPRIEYILEDKIKKEIFRRYNSGITPLNTAEIDNATYDDDELTNTFKQALKENIKLRESLQKYFMARNTNEESAMLQFMRKYLILASFPIQSFATGGNRSEVFDLLYGAISNNTEDTKETCQELLQNLEMTTKILDNLSERNSSNKLINECLLWAINILTESDVAISDLLEPKNITLLDRHLLKSERDYLAENSHHYASIITRHRSMANFMSDFFNFDFSIFLRDENFRHKVKDLRQSEEEAKLKLDELASLRVQKPEPSLIPIEEITNELSGNRFLVRPSYQRKEKINPIKASAIIESIILDISLPPIFIYKNGKNVKEVIDGQQRLLSILGFLGKQYTDENGTISYPKNLNYKLKRLKILTEWNGKTYSDLPFEIQDRILDFKISVIEIDSALNPNFDPVDLFIRLNNKPYPIKENSFEMWNSFMDKEIIQSIRELADKNITWFFIKTRAEDRSQDRMLNEELITLLAYIRYNKKHRPEYNALGFYLRDGKINTRISDKKNVTSLLENISTDIKLKERFSKCIDEISSDIGKLEHILDPSDKKHSLTSLLTSDGTSSRRLLVDFYVLFEILHRVSINEQSNLSFDQVKVNLAAVQNELKSPAVADPEISYQEYFSKFFNNLNLQT